jgi:CheY-like chemotaxis protein
MRILVCEPQAEVRELLGHVVERLGHEPVFPNCSAPRDVDVVLLEPADPWARSAASPFLDRRSRTPVVCASIYPDSGHLGGLRPLAYLVKPFGLAELEQALTAAVESVAPGRAA